MNKKKVVLDMGLNIVATAIPTVVLQLLILPLVAKYVDSQHYGLIITILAVLNVVPSTIGNVLNNIRLLHEADYVEKGVTGDFPLLLLFSEALNTIIIAVLSLIYLGTKNIFDIILVTVAGFLWLGQEYYIVAFRIKLNYTGVFINNIFLVFGYMIGYLIFVHTKYWEFIYIIGFLSSYVYIAFKSDILKEKYVITFNFRMVSKDAIQLFIATILARMITYADKILLYPLLGGTAVTIYYVSTILGKVVALAITPINSVALSYLSKIQKKPDALYKWVYSFGIIICIIGYILSIIFSRPILGLLYPYYVDQAMIYIYVTSASVVVNILNSIITPFVLKYFGMQWQMVINGSSTIIYIIVSIILFYLFGLMGFCFGSLLASVTKLMITSFIYKFCTPNKRALETFNEV